MSIVHDPAVGYRPCLVLAHGDNDFATDALRRFRRLGWDVYQAHAGPEARRLARLLEAELVVLDTDLEGESGWLTCAKLTRERPGKRVVLIAEDEGPRDRGMAEFVGASAFFRREGGLTALMQASWQREAREAA